MKKRISSIACLLLIASAMSWPQFRQADVAKDGSFMTYRLVHPLHKIEATSKDVEYKLEFDPAKKEIRSVAARVDVTTFDSGNSNRDSHAMEVIDAISYPEAAFISTGLTQYGDSVKVAGRITFHGVTKQIVIPGALRWSANRVEFRGDFTLSLTEFKIDRPSLLLIPVEDGLSFECVAAFVWQAD